MKTIAQIVEHIAADPLVLWSWAPGPGPQPAPGTAPTHAALLKAWAARGAECPRD